MKKNVTISIIFLGLSLFMFRCTAENYPKPNLVSGSITVDNLTRTYLVNLPSNHADTSHALVLVLHGAGGSAAQCERDYGWTPKSNSEQFIVAYPDGVASDKPLKLRTWNAGRCCDYASQAAIDDVRFISELIDQLSSRYLIDRKRIFVTGMSNGAMMAYRLACEIPEKIAAIAAVSGPLMTIQSCDPSRPLPILHIHSELDTKVPYEGGAGLFGYAFSSVDSTLNVWASINHCQDLLPIVTQKELYTIYHWDTCDEVIESYITKDGGHAWPGGRKPREKADNPSQAFNATDVIWSFFKEHHLP